MECKKCHTVNDHDAIYCKRCGSELNKVYVCKKCGKKLGDDELYCIQCGTKSGESGSFLTKENATILLSILMIFAFLFTAAVL